MNNLRRHLTEMAGRLAISAAGGYLFACAIKLVFHPVGGLADMTLGWLASLILHVAGMLLFTAALGKPANVFLGLVLGGIFTRLFILIILIFAVLVGGFLALKPFLIGLLPAYFAGSWMEIAWFASMNGSVTDSKSLGKHV